MSRYLTLPSPDRHNPTRVDKCLVQGAYLRAPTAPSHDPEVMVPTTLPTSLPHLIQHDPDGFMSIHSSQGPWSPSSRITAAPSSLDSLLCRGW